MNKPIRIVQLIDSLAYGGAEHMAVLYANTLYQQGVGAGLVATRAAGPLQDQLHTEVPYLCLHRQWLLDVGALWRLRRFCLQHQVTHIQAHSSTFFMGLCLKGMLPSLQLIWHDHYGWSDQLEHRSGWALRAAAPWFKGTIAVNQALALWAQQKLQVTNVRVFRNFTKNRRSMTSTPLPGLHGKRVVCVANGRPQKNIDWILEVAEQTRLLAPDWTFHWIGHTVDPDYVHAWMHKRQQHQLTERVFVHGGRADVADVLAQCEIGLICSHSEGLPLALLEYGQAGLAVVSTSVGDIDQVIKHGKHGLLVAPSDLDGFVQSVQQVMDQALLRQQLGQALQQRVMQEFSAAQVVHQYVAWLQQLD